MRNTEPAGNTSSTTRLSSWALLRSWPNGFSTITRRQEPGSLVDNPDVRSLSMTVGRNLGNRQVESVVSVRSPDSVEVGQNLRQFGKRLVRIETTGDEPHASGQLFPDVLAEGGSGVFANGIFGDLREVLVCPIPAGEPNECE